MKKKVGIKKGMTVANGGRRAQPAKKTKAINPFVWDFQPGAETKREYEFFVKWREDPDYPQSSKIFVANMGGKGPRYSTIARYRRDGEWDKRANAMTEDRIRIEEKARREQDIKRAKKQAIARAQALDLLAENTVNLMTNYIAMTSPGEDGKIKCDGPAVAAIKHQLALLNIQPESIQTLLLAHRPQMRAYEDLSDIELDDLLEHHDNALDFYDE